MRHVPIWNGLSRRRGDGNRKNFRLLTLLAFVCLCLLFFTAGVPNSSAKPVPLLVITDLRTVKEKSSIAEANAFSEFMRREIEQSGTYRVLSRSSMLAILKKNKFKLPCFDLPCFISMGNILGADQVLAGNIHRENGKFEMTLRLIDCKEQKILNSVYRTKSTLTETELFGSWGRGVIEEVFKENSGNTKSLILKENGEIPDRILNKYPGMVYIPAGEVFLGSETGDKEEQPVVRKLVDAFYIGKYEVTNSEYKQFVEAANYPPPPHWDGGVLPAGLEKHPVVWISFEDADAYCQWKGARLPTEAEWERAAKAHHQWEYPWGNEFDKEKANTWESKRRGTTPVGLKFRGASPFGAEDMAGNAFEWVSGFFESHSGRNVSNPLYDQHLRILKGGSWNFSAYYARVAHRFPRSGGEQGRSYGFRIVRSD